MTASPDEIATIGAGIPESPDHLWQLLDGAPPGWLLIVDNADELEYLGRPGRDGGQSAEPVQGANGWIRAGRTGLVLVTSRHRDSRRWPRNAFVLDVGELDDEAAAAVLLDLAPQAGSKRSARTLARRLGRLPLALRLAGLYLSSQYAEHASFTAYRTALESDPYFLRAIELSRDDPAAIDRMVLMKTWELSLDALAARGIPQARPTLRLLNCFAPGDTVPLALLKGRLDAFLANCVEGATLQSLSQTLAGLDNLGLIAAANGSIKQGIAGPGIRLHAVVADTNRLHLIEDPSEELIRTTAVTLIAAELDGLTADRPSAWARFRLLTPHLQAILINSAPRLVDTALTTLAETTGSVAVAYGYMNRSELGITLLTRLLDARQTWRGPMAEVRLTARQQLANLLSSSGRPESAERIWREVMTIRLRDWPADSPLVLVARHHFLEARSQQLPWDQVQPAFHRLLEEEERALSPVYGENHFVALVARHNHVTALRHLGRTAETDTEARRLMDDLRETFGEDHVFTKRDYGLGDFLIMLILSSPDLNQNLAADPALEAFDALEARFGADTSPGIVRIVAQGMFRKAVLLKEAGRARDSVALYDELVGRYDGMDSVVLRHLVAMSLHNTAISAVWDPDQSVEAAQEASIRYQEESPPPQHLVAQAMLDKAVLLGQTGDGKVTEPQ
ncbi:MAG: hypothetical protein ABW022_24330 [Actinoplanes sp.]